MWGLYGASLLFWSPYCLLLLGREEMRILTSELGSGWKEGVSVYNLLGGSLGQRFLRYLVTRGSQHLTRRE